MKTLLCTLIKIYLLSVYVYACVPENAECNPDLIYLLESDDEIHKGLNDKFMEYMRPRTAVSKLTKTKCYDGLMGAIQASKSCLQVIHLYVPDFYNHNYNILDGNLIYAGDVGPGETVDVCIGNYSKEQSPHSSENHKETCSKGVQTLYHVKLVSETVALKRELFNSVQTFNISSVLTLPTVLICEDRSTITYIKRSSPNNFEYSSCNGELSEALAILSPKPFKMEYDITVPTVFYQDSYLMPENDGFRNAVPLTRSWSKLANALLEFMEKMEWMRIAVISDDSPYSEEFQKSLSALFDDRKIVYTLKSCQEKVCDFQQALQTLRNSNARIVFANVDEDYAEKLATQSRDTRMVSSNDIIWIVRDWSHEIAIGAAQKIGDIFIVSLGPAIYNDLPYHTIRAHNIISNLKYSRIKEAANAIANVYNIMENENERSRQDYQRVFTHHLLQKTLNKISHGYVTKIGSDSRRKLVMSMKIYDKQVVAIQWETPYSHYKPSDMPEACYLRSKNFYKPCNDITMLLLSFVVAVFVVIFLAILYTFDNLNYPYISL